jgi:hypothetical protein
MKVFIFEGLYYNQPTVKSANGLDLCSSETRVTYLSEQHTAFLSSHIKTHHNKHVRYIRSNLLQVHIHILNNRPVENALEMIAHTQKEWRMNTLEDLHIYLDKR